MKEPSREQDREYRYFLHHVPGALLQCLDDQKGTILEVNQGFLSMFGFSRDELSENFHDHFFEMINPSDHERFISQYSRNPEQNESIIFHFRVICKNGSYKWVVGSIQSACEAGRESQIFSVMLDIDKDWKTFDDLRLRAERDALTGLYNREEAQRRVIRHLEHEPDHMCAFFIIDTDNFKQVNDSLGHLFGDTVLTELAAGMRKLVRQSDVVGRIGGDEFLVFLKDIPSAEIAQQKAAGLLEVFRNLFQGEKKPFEITCSIGGALYPCDGTDFQSLYQNADLALYRAKSRGKNQYALFQREEDTTVGDRGYSVLGAAIDSNQNTSGKLDNLVSYVFQILYDAEDISNAIQLILEIVGKRFDVSRAYVFENSEDGRYCDNTFEWCNTGISPQKDLLQHFEYATLEGYSDLFKEDSVFYCRDIYSLKPRQTALFVEQGIRSTLQCAIQDKGAFVGFVGFDECTGKRMWTKAEIGMLSLISQILTIFLQRKRTSDRDRQLVVRLNTILDTQDAFIYTIRKDNYELIYLNHKTREQDPSVKPGMSCYRAFFNREQPCEHCPLKGNTSEVYNSKYGLWTKVRVSPMKWGEYDAYLLTCFDITEYKQLGGCE